MEEMAGRMEGAESTFQVCCSELQGMAAASLEEAGLAFGAEGPADRRQQHPAFAPMDENQKALGVSPRVVAVVQGA